MVAVAVEQKRAAIYCRVSTQKQEDGGSSLETQEASCRRYAAEHGYIVDDSLVFREVYSGVELWDRPKLTVLRDAIRREQIDAVLVHDIDRLSRDPVHLGVLLTESDYAGVEIAFVLTPLDNSPEGQLIQYVRGYAAKIEHMKIRERSLRGKCARLASGKLHSYATELYGYRRDHERGVRVIHEPEAAIVRRIFHEVAVEGRSIRSVTAELNAEGIPSPSADKRSFSVEGGKTAHWGKSSIGRILQHEAYKGETIVWKRKSVGKGGKSIIRDESEWVRLPAGTTPAIVTPEVWDLAQRRHADNIAAATATTRNAERPILLRGLVFCAVCGRPMYAEMEKGRLLVYRCSSRSKAGGRCSGRRVNGKRLEAWVWSQVESVLADPSQIADAVAWLREQGPDEGLTGDRDATARMVAKLNQQQERLVRRIADTDDDEVFNLLTREIKRIGEQRDQAQQRLGELERRIAEQAGAAVRLEELENYVERVRANLGDLSFDNKRDAIVALVERVVAEGPDPEGWRIEGAIPVGVGVPVLTC